jgi:hypothetical protein
MASLAAVRSESTGNPALQLSSLALEQRVTDCSPAPLRPVTIMPTCFEIF